MFKDRIHERLFEYIGEQKNPDLRWKFPICKKGDAGCPVDIAIIWGHLVSPFEFKLELGPLDANGMSWDLPDVTVFLDPQSGFETEKGCAAEARGVDD